MIKSKFAYKEAFHTYYLLEIALGWENVFQNLRFRNQKNFYF